MKRMECGLLDYLSRGCRMLVVSVCKTKKYKLIVALCSRYTKNKALYSSARRMSIDFLFCADKIVLHGKTNLVTCSRLQICINISLSLYQLRSD